VSKKHMLIGIPPKQPTPRQINAHLALMTTYCYVYNADGNLIARITRARTRNGMVEGRALGSMLWFAIPPDAQVRLTWY
jgi:YD repeat-containing protein